MSQYPPPPQYPTQYMPPQYPAAPGMTADYSRPVRRTVRHVGVFSAAKIVAMMTALFYAIFGLFYVAFFALCGGMLASIPSSFDDSRFNGSSFFAGGIVLALIFYVGAIIFGFIGGFIVGAIYAWIYNLSVGLTGGLEVDVA